MDNILFFLATDLPRGEVGTWFLSYTDTFSRFVDRNKRDMHQVHCTECGACNDDAAYIQFERETNESYGIVVTWMNRYVMADCGHVIGEIEVT